MNASALIVAAFALSGCAWSGSIGPQEPVAVAPAPSSPSAIDTLITGLSEAQTVRTLERQLAR